jgi:hypothetical protein
MKEKQAVDRKYKPRYQKAAKKTKSALLDEFTWLTGYHRKSAIQLLSAKPVREVLAFANRKGKYRYTGEVIASLRLVWNFFWYKCELLSGLTITIPPEGAEEKQFEEAEVC